MSIAVRIVACFLFVCAACGDSSPHDPLTGVSATATPRPTTWLAPVDVTFDCDAVGGEAPFSYVWDFGDGTQSPLDGPGHTYTVPGRYTATCQVTDATGDVESLSLDIEVLPATPTAKIDVLDTQLPTCAVTGQTVVQLSSAGSTDPDGDTLWSEWALVSRPQGSTAMLSSTTGDSPSFAPDVDGDYLVRLRVEDGSGLSDSVDLTISSEPASRLVAVAGDGQTALDGEPLAPVAYEVDTQCGLPVAGTTVTFAPPSGVTVSPASAVTGADGRVTTQISAGCSLGANVITVTTDSPPLISHLLFDNTQGGPWNVRLQSPSDVGVPGPMTVTATVLDHCGYQVSGDNTTTFTLSLREATNDSSAAFQALARGTAVDTSDPQAWVVRASGGAVEATLTDSAPETISFAMTDSQATGLQFTTPPNLVYIASSTIPSSCSDATRTVAFLDAPPPAGRGTMTISGGMDAQILDLYDESATMIGAFAAPFGTECARQPQHVYIDEAVLASLQLDGGITLQLKPRTTPDCTCAPNQLQVELTYPSGVAAHFTP